MTKEEYEEYVQQKAGTPIDCSLLGLAGETGELLDTIKKIQYHGHNRQDLQSKLVHEAGDALWYLTDIITRYIGSDLNTIMLKNKEKLDARYAQRFTVEESINRVPDKT